MKRDIVLIDGDNALKLALHNVQMRIVQASQIPKAYWEDVYDLRPPAVYIPGRHSEVFRLELIPPWSSRLPLAEERRLWEASSAYDPVKWLLDLLRARLDPYPPFSFEKPDATRLAPASEFKASSGV